MSDRADVLQGTLDLIVLQTLAPGPLHGYAVAQRINQTSRALIQRNATEMCCESASAPYNS